MFEEASLDIGRQFIPLRDERCTETLQNMLLFRGENRWPV